MPNAAPSFQPLYLQVKGLVEKSLAAGEWGPGAAIPSEALLAQRFGVSQGTVRKAIDALAGDNLVVRRQGKGTFVATHTEERSSLFRFLRIRRNDGSDVAPVTATRTGAFMGGTPEDGGLQGRPKRFRDAAKLKPPKRRSPEGGTALYAMRHSRSAGWRLSTNSYNLYKT